MRLEDAHPKHEGLLEAFCSKYFSTLNSEMYVSGFKMAGWNILNWFATFCRRLYYISQVHPQEGTNLRCCWHILSSLDNLGA